MFMIVSCYFIRMWTHCATTGVHHKSSAGCNTCQWQNQEGPWTSYVCARLALADTVSIKSIIHQSIVLFSKTINNTGEIKLENGFKEAVSPKSRPELKIRLLPMTCQPAVTSLHVHNNSSMFRTWSVRRTRKRLSTLLYCFLIFRNMFDDSAMNKLRTRSTISQRKRLVKQVRAQMQQALPSNESCLRQFSCSGDGG